MRSIQQNLLITLALALCGLCAWQWYRETGQRNSIDTLNQRLYEKAVAFQDATNSIATLSHQVSQMDVQITELRAEARTNELTIADQLREISRLRFQGGSLTNQIVEYKSAVDKLNAKLKEAYDGIQKQNVAVQELVTQRDEFVQKYNDSVKDRNDIVAKYNDLAAQIRKLQGGSTKQ